LAAPAAGAGYNISLLNNAGSPAPIALTVGGNNSSTTYAGVLSGGGSLIKAGSGALTLSGTNTYTGATTVAAGQLTVNGSNSSSSLTTVQSGATLGGSGTVGALALQSGGTIAPGNSPGTLSVIGTTTWAGGGNYNWQLLDATGTAGSGWDTVSITGALDLTNLTLGSPFNVNVWSLSTFAGSGGNALNFNSSLSYSWTIASASSGITGFDANEFSIYTTAVNGTNGFSNPFTGTFSVGVTGNNLNLNYDPTPVPEPGSTLAVLALFSSGVLNRRKRVVRH
jgi:autotransporter-associated beta strand protein